LLFRWSITAQTPLLRVPQENLSWYSVLNIFFSQNHKCWLYDALCTRICWYWTRIAGVIWKWNRGPFSLRHTANIVLRDRCSCGRCGCSRRTVEGRSIVSEWVVDVEVTAADACVQSPSCLASPAAGCARWTGSESRGTAPGLPCPPPPTPSAWPHTTNKHPLLMYSSPHGTDRLDPTQPGHPFTGRHNEYWQSINKSTNPGFLKWRK